MKLPAGWGATSVQRAEAKATQGEGPAVQDQSWRVFPETMDRWADAVSQEIAACYNHGKNLREAERE